MMGFFNSPSPSLVQTYLAGSEAKTDKARDLQSFYLRSSAGIQPGI